jgi:hypothetical protein
MDFNQTREYLAGVERTRRQFLAATGRPDPFAEKVKGAIFAMVAPRLALDAAMPDLNEALQGVDAHNFRHHRKHIADSVRRAVRGRLGRDADLSDIEEMLAALEREEDDGEEPGRDTSYDARRRRHGRDEERVSEPGMSASLDPSQHPFSESEAAEDEELEELKGQMSPEAYDRLQRRASDRRRRARDSEESPFDAQQRRRTARDDPMFEGAPRTGGGMMRREASSVDRPGMGYRPPDVAAKDKRRRYGADSKPSFGTRFGFTSRVSDTASATPIKVAVG